MRIYHSGLTLEVAQRYHDLYPEKKLDVLLSYGRPNSEKWDILTTYRDLFGGVIYDSGAYTLNNARVLDVEIDLEAYADDLKHTAKLYDFYFNLDEDFSKDGFEVNYWNQLHLESLGFTPVPVIHNIKGEEVDEYIRRGYEIVSIGSDELGSTNQESIRAQSEVVSRMYEKGIKVHLLGVVRYEQLSTMPIHSCDSSNWNQKASRGVLFWWNPGKDGTDKTDRIYLPDRHPLKKGRLYFKDYPYRRHLEEYLDKELGLSYPQLMGRDRLINRALVYIHYCEILKELVDRKHEEVGYQFAI